MAACLPLCAAENWPGYEGTLHQSSSAVDVVPGTLSVKWSRRFNQLVKADDGRIQSWCGVNAGATFHARNLSLLNGKLALVGTVDTHFRSRHRLRQIGEVARQGARALRDVLQQPCGGEGGPARRWFR